MVNSCHFIGNVGRDPESKFFGSGTQVASFSIALNKKSKDGQKETMWLDVRAFGKLAEIVMEHVKRGGQVYVEGSLEVREYEKDGQKRKVVAVLANTIRNMGGRAAAPAREEEPEFVGL